MSRHDSSLHQRPLWQRLIAPMLLASLGLHGLFLLIPMASSDEVAVPPPDPEEDSISITRVPPSAPEVAVEAGNPGNPPAGPAQAIAPPSRQQPAPSPQAQTTAAQSQSAPRPSAPQVRESLPDLSEEPSTSIQSPNPDPPSPGPPSMVITPLPADQARTLLASLQTSDRIANSIADLRAYLDRRYSYQPERTTREALRTNQEQWIAASRQSLDRPDLEPEIYRPDLEISHRQRVCFNPEPWGTPVLGFVLTPSGGFAADPVVLRSTGYGLLDTQAIAALKAADLMLPEATTAYTIEAEVEIDYGRYDCLTIKPPEAS